MRPDIVLHQEEPGTHWTSVRSLDCSEDFITVPHSSQGTVGYDMVCVPPQTIGPSWSLTVWTETVVLYGSSSSFFLLLGGSTALCSSHGVTADLLVSHLCWRHSKPSSWTNWTTCPTWLGCSCCLVVPVDLRRTSLSFTCCHWFTDWSLTDVVFTVIFSMVADDVFCIIGHF